VKVVIISSESSLFNTEKENGTVEISCSFDHCVLITFVMSRPFSFGLDHFLAPSHHNLFCQARGHV
jgi:hypothetical protein